MASLRIDEITVGEKVITILDSDPKVNGYQATIGSIAVVDDGGIGKLWLKSGSGDTDWSELLTKGNFSIADTNTIDLSKAIDGTLSADLKYQDTNSIDFSDDGSGLKADVKVSTATNAQLEVLSDGLHIKDGYFALQSDLEDIVINVNETAQDAVGGILTDTNTVDFTYDDNLNIISASVKYQDTNSIDFSDDGSGLKADVKVSAATNAALEILADGLHIIDGYFQVAGTTIEDAQDAVGTILVDTNSIDLTYVDGTPSISADLKLSTVAADSEKSLVSLDIQTDGLRAQISDSIILSKLSAVTPVLYDSLTGVISMTTADALTDGYVSTSAQDFAGNKTFLDDVIITGDLFVNGSQTILNTQTVTTEDNLIVVNSGESGAGVTAGVAGLQVDRGSATDFQFVFDESQDNFRVGQVGSTQAVATREDAPAIRGIAYWNDTDKKFDTEVGFEFDDSTNILSVDNVDSLKTTTEELIISNGTAVNKIVQANVNTTDGTTTTVYSFAVPTGQVLLLEARIVGKQTNGINNAAYVRTARFYNNAGTLTIHNLQSDYTSESINAYNATLAVSGTNAVVRVTGNTAHNITWIASIQIQTI